MIRWMLAMILMGIIQVSGANVRELSFQIYVQDSTLGTSLEGNGEVLIESSIVSSGVDYFINTHSTDITNGIVNTSVSFDMDRLDHLGVFDQPDVQLHIVLSDRDFTDEIFIPLSTSPLAIFSQLTDRAVQLKSKKLMNIDYENDVIQVGGATGTSNAFNVNGTLTADKFIGDGYLIYNIRGSGLNDDHSLEKFGSRTCSPDKEYALSQSNGESELSNCLFGEDVLFISSDPYVGIHMTKERKDRIDPKMPFDVGGRVFFQAGEDGVGGLHFPLTKHQTLMAWDHSNAAFKAGYVSRDASVESDTFSRSTVSIGRDIATYGLNSSVFGGESNSIQGNYSAIVGGIDNQITGNYSILVGTTSDDIHKAYVATIGGENNDVSSNYSVLLSSKNNKLKGQNHTIFGHDNVVDGDATIIYGDSNKVNANRVMIMGDSATVDHDDSWVINMATSSNVKTTASNQILWVSDYGVSINTNNASEILVADGDLVADYFYGDGSQLTNFSKLDKYWLMFDNLMTISNFKLGVKTSVGDVRQNRMNLYSGLRLGSDGSSSPGTLAYENGDLVGVGKTSTSSLLVQDTDTIYKVSREFQKEGNEIRLVTDDVDPNVYLVFNGQDWEPSRKMLWDNVSPSFVTYSRPISLWRSQAYLGRLTLSHPNQNLMVFSTEDKRSGVSLLSAGERAQRDPILIGFNLKSPSIMSRFSDDVPGYLFSFLSMQEGGVLLKSTDHQSLMHLNASGKLSFFADDFTMDVNIPKKSRIDDLVIDQDPQPDGRAELSHIDFETAPFFSVDRLRQLDIQAANTATINFKLKKQVRMQITNESELLLSYDDRYSLGQPMVTVPDGDMLISKGRYIGVFNSDRDIQTGVRFNHDSVVFVPEPAQDNNVIFRHFGVGLRVTPNRVMAIKDDDASVFIEKSTLDGSSFVVFSKERRPKWTFRSWSDTHNGQAIGQLDIRDALGTRIIQMNDVINIHTPIEPGQEFNIKGDLSLIGMTTFLTNAISPDVPGESKPFAIVSGNQVLVKPVDNASGIEFYSSGGHHMSMNHGSVSIGDGLVPESPTKSLYVNPATFINYRLFLNDENIDHKTITWTNPETHQLASFKHHKDNIIQQLSFDYDTGFNIISTQDYVVELTFQEHFSSFNGLVLADVLPKEDISDDDADDGQSEPTLEESDEESLGPQIIIPNGIDTMSYDGEGISITANNVTQLGDPDGEMDYLRFFNDLMNGGDIEGDLSILGTLNVIYDYEEPGVVPFKLRGNISDLDVHTVPFPWRHREKDAHGERVHYEYVITENVGIGLSTPEYPLEVLGVSSINILESPSINVTGAEFDPLYDYLSIRSQHNQLLVTVNAANESVREYLRFSGMNIQDNLFSLNRTDAELVHMVNFFPVPEENNANAYIEGKDESWLSFLDAMKMQSQSNGDFRIRSLTGRDDLIMMSNTSSLYASKRNGLGIGNFSVPKNTLDVSGNMVIGKSLSGRVVAPENSLMVEGKFGISTSNPIAYTDVQGFDSSPASMVVATSGDYLGSLSGLGNDLVIESHLFIEEYEADSDYNVLVNGPIVGIGGLYFNKKQAEEDTELSFFNHPISNRFVIGYGALVQNRLLNVSAQDYIKITPNKNAIGIYVDDFSNVALGHNQPISRFHVKKPNITFKIESTAVNEGDAMIQFDSSGVGGVVGMSTHLPEKIRLSDGRDPENLGDVMAIDASGNVDVAYNVINQSTPQPSHNVRVDVLGKVNATNIKENNTILTHMPEGSIIMWSGWTDELPDGWLLCTGEYDSSDHPKTTDKCSMADYFIVGKKPGDEWGNDKSVGQHTIAVTTEGTYDHEHVGPKHRHLGFTGNGRHQHSGMESGNTSAPGIKGPHSTNRFHNNTSSKIVGQKNTYKFDYKCEKYWSSGACAAPRAYNQELIRVTENNNQHGYEYKPSDAGAHGHNIQVDHTHTVSSNNSGDHQHNLEEKTSNEKTIELGASFPDDNSIIVRESAHLHANALHSHVLDNQPVYYKLAFIYLAGETDYGGKH